jgi:hypothetical protein
VELEVQPDRKAVIEDPFGEAAGIDRAEHRRKVDFELASRE